MRNYYKSVAVGCNEIDLTASATPVAREHHESDAGQVLRGHVLPSPAQLVAMHLHSPRRLHVDLPSLDDLAVTRLPRRTAAVDRAPTDLWTTGSGVDNYVA
jgi:hypothetical protein